MKKPISIFSRVTVLSIAIFCAAALAISDINNNNFDKLVMIFGVIFFVWLYETIKGPGEEV